MLSILSFIYKSPGKNSQLHLLQYLINRDEIRSANLALISGRQMHRINACIFLVAITKTQNQSIFLFGSALRLSVWLIYNLSFKLFYIYKIPSLAFRTKQPSDAKTIVWLPLGS